MIQTDEAVNARLQELFSSAGASWKAVRILVVGPDSRALVDDKESALGATVEHLVFNAAEAEVVAANYPARRVYLGRKSLGAQRFDLAASFMEFSEAQPERLILSILSSHGETLLLDDAQSADSPERAQRFASAPSALGWAERRRLFVTRLLNEFGFLAVQGFGSAGRTYYVAERGAYRPLLAHVHIPKTGGISLQQNLERSFPGRFLPLDCIHHTGSFGNAATIHARLLAAPEIDAVSSHLLRFNYPAVVGGRLMLYFTLIRHPLEQFKSYVRFLKYNPTVLLGQEPSTYAPDMAELSLVEIAEVLMHPRSGCDLDARWVMPCRFLGLTDRSEPVIRKLMGFVMVGIFERMQESMELLRAKLAPYGVELLTDALPHLNPSKGTNMRGEPIRQESTVEAALEAHGPVIERFLRLRHAGDFEVYDWAVKNFEQQWRAR